MPRHRNPPFPDNHRQAIVWDTIERLAFRPDNPATWLSLYAKTLHKIWDIEPLRWNSNVMNQLFIPFLRLKCTYTNEGCNKYGATISDSDRRFLVLHIAPEHLSKADLHGAYNRYPHQERDRSLMDDVRKVLNGMIFHTRVHSHLHCLGFEAGNADHADESKLLGLREIRIGTGIENFYVFLFHLRYQFCLVAQSRRDNERERLVQLFQNAIAGGKRTVSSGDLFGW